MYSYLKKLKKSEECLKHKGCIKQLKFKKGGIVKNYDKSLKKEKLSKWKKKYSKILYKYENS